MKEALAGENWGEDGYPRQMQILAEVLQAAVDSGLDVAGACTLAEVRAIALRHFANFEE